MRSSIFVVIIFDSQYLLLIQEDIQDVALSREALLDCFVECSFGYKVVNEGRTIMACLSLADRADTFNDLIV